MDAGRSRSSPPNRSARTVFSASLRIFAAIIVFASAVAAEAADSTASRAAAAFQSREDYQPECENCLILFHNQHCADSRRIDALLSEIAQLKRYVARNLSYVRINDYELRTAAEQRFSVSVYPTIVLRRAGDSGDGAETFFRYEYDLNKRDLTYFIDLWLFDTLPDSGSRFAVQSLQRQPFALVLIGDESLYAREFAEFTAFARDRPLYYHFRQVSNLTGYLEEHLIAGAEPSALYLQILKRDERFDQHVRASGGALGNFSAVLAQFYEYYAKPFYITSPLTHRVRQYLAQTRAFGVALFCRKHTLVDRFVHSQFYNYTRDLRRVLYDEAAEDVYNHLHDKAAIRRSVVFLVLDYSLRESAHLNRRLLWHYGLRNHDLPVVVALRFFAPPAGAQRFEKYRLEIRQNHLYATQLTNLLNNLVAEEGGWKAREQLIYHRENTTALRRPDANVATFLTAQGFENVLSERYSKMHAGRSVYLLLLFTSAGCRLCAQASAVVDRLSTEFEATAARLASKITFVNTDLDQNDNFLNLPLRTLPALYLFDQSHNHRELLPQTYDYETLADELARSLSTRSPAGAAHASDL